MNLLQLKQTLNKVVDAKDDKIEVVVWDGADDSVTYPVQSVEFVLDSDSRELQLVIHADHPLKIHE